MECSGKASLAKKSFYLNFMSSCENGRIIVKKPNDNGYGVELGAVQDAERIQVQVVSFHPSSDISKASQDRDRETVWCSEFYRLQSLLEKSGTALQIEKALPIGAKPLKQVQDPSPACEITKKSKDSNLKTMQD